MARITLRRRGRCGQCIFFRDGYCLLKGKPVKPNYFGCKFFSRGDIIDILRRELNREQQLDKVVRYTLFAFLLLFPIITNANPIDSLLAILLGALGFFGIKVHK